MKMVSAAKLRRAQDAILSARPFAKKMLEVLNSLATRAEPDAHPLLRVREPRNVDVIVISADKGSVRLVQRQYREKGGGLPQRNVDLRHASIFSSSARSPATTSSAAPSTSATSSSTSFSDLTYDTAGSIARPLIERYSNRRLGGARRRRVSHLQRVQERHPARRRSSSSSSPSKSSTSRTPEEELDYIYEPSAAEIYDAVIPRHVEYQVWHALLESAAAEHAARMTAMENASKNAAELIEQLTLTMNKVRQATITREILEIVSGAEAIK